MKIDFNTSASFDVDPQKGFTNMCPNELPVADGENIVESLNNQAKFAKYRIFSKDWQNMNAVWVASEENPQFSN